LAETKRPIRLSLWQMGRPRFFKVSRHRRGLLLVPAASGARLFGDR
jgi:hypothetical protein